MSRQWKIDELHLSATLDPQIPGEAQWMFEGVHRDYGPIYCVKYLPLSDSLGWRTFFNILARQLVILETYNPHLDPGKPWQEKAS